MGIQTRQDKVDRTLQEQQLAALLEQNRLLAGIFTAVDYLARAEATRREEAVR